MHDTTGKSLTLTALEVAHELRIARNGVYELCASGELPSFRIGRAVRIPREALEAYIARGNAAGGGDAA